VREFIHENTLSDHRPIAFVVRLVVDRRDQLVYGEVVDHKGTVLGRFREWERLPDLLRAWLQETVNQ
jgi:hypothetical protein